MWHLNSRIIIRPEAKGALIFNPDNAQTLYVDKEGLIFINDFSKDPLAIKKFPVLLFRFFKKIGIFVKNKKPEDNFLQKKIETCIDQHIRAIPNSLSVPETLHIALTNNCNQSCQGCFYSMNNTEKEILLSATTFRKILDQAGLVKVFQFAFGGGEPLLHPGILEFVQLARRQNIVTNITTSGNLLTPKLARELKKSGLGQIQISLNGASEQINAKTRPNFTKAIRAINICRKTGLDFGINTLITRDNLSHLPALIKLSQQAGAVGINLLRPKPPVSSPGWLQKASLTAEENLHLHRLLVQSINDNTRITLDQSLCFLAFHRNPDELYFNGVWGCGAGRRFLTIDPDGSVFPCSHFREPIGNGGNFMESWEHSATLEKFRSLEDNIIGFCKECKMVKVCRGCRAVVVELGGTFFDSDKHCPQHILNIGVQKKK